MSSEKQAWGRRHGFSYVDSALSPMAVPAPEKFSYGHRRVKNFIFKMKNYFLLTAPTESDRTLIQAFMLYLTGPALAWARVYVGDDELIEKYKFKDDFDGFLQHFGEAFGAATLPAPRSLNLSQGSNTVDEYVAKFFNVLSWIDESNLDLPKVFYEGLTDEIRGLVDKEAGGDTLMDVIIKARKVDARMEAERIESGQRKLD